MKLHDLFEANESQAAGIKDAEDLIHKLEAKTGKSFEKQVTGLYRRYLGGESDRSMEERVGDLEPDEANQLEDELTTMAHGLAKANGYKIQYMGRGRVRIVAAK